MVFPPKDQPAPHHGGGVNSQVGECLVGLDHQGGRSLTEEPPRALREVERLTRNPEKLANAGGRCWKDTLGRKRSFGTHQPPYPARRGLVTAWQKTKKLLHDDGFSCLNHLERMEESLGLKKQWYKRSRKGDYSGLDTWKGWRRKDYQMQLYMDM